MCYIDCMKKNFFLFVLTILLFEVMIVAPAFAHPGHEGTHEIAATERAMPAVGSATVPAIAPDAMVRPMRGEESRMMILPYESSIAPVVVSSDSSRPALRRVTKQIQEKRDIQQQEREALRKEREEKLEGLDRSERAQERMSDVSKRVEEILANKDENGGIGELVREVAREHAAGQATLSARLEKVESRRGAVRWFLGNDRQTLLELKKDATTIDQRIARIESNLDSMSEEERETALDLIESLKAQRTELLTTVEEKDGQFSVVGWLKKLFGQTN